MHPAVVVVVVAALSGAVAEGASPVRISGVHFDGYLPGTPEPDSAIRLKNTDPKNSGPKRADRPLEIEDLELSRDTIQDLVEGEADQVKGGIGRVTENCTSGCPTRARQCGVIKI